MQNQANRQTHILKTAPHPQDDRAAGVVADQQRMQTPQSGFQYPVATFSKTYHNVLSARRGKTALSKTKEVWYLTLRCGHEGMTFRKEPPKTFHCRICRLLRLPQTQANQLLDRHQRLESARMRPADPVKQHTEMNPGAAR